MWLFLSFVPFMPPPDIITITTLQQHYNKKQPQDLDTIECHFGLQIIPLSSPVYANPLFTPYSPFDQLVGVFQLQRTHFFRYLQIRFILFFICGRFAGFPAVPSSTLIDTILSNPYFKGIISELHCLVQNKVTTKIKATH